MKNNYLRIGTSYYKKSLYPNLYGGSTEILINWTAEVIRQDHGRKFLSEIEVYDGFICIPENREEFFKKRVLEYYNTYHAISKSPYEGDLKNTLDFIKHIFGDQIELGIDFIQLLYLKPTQILPILCLVSNERATGKSTFLKWLHCIFEHNLTYLTNNDFASNFNSDWSSKLIIAIDEVLFKTDELTERIKYLSTTNFHKTESKGKDKRETPFFGKFIMASNNETSFIKIDCNEIRFWVRKINRYEKEDVNLLDKLIDEIPAFLYFLSKREYSTKNNSRMWFLATEIKTKALQKLMQSNNDKIEFEIANILINVIEGLDIDVLDFCFSDLQNLMNKFKVKYDTSIVKKIIRLNWKLPQQSNSNQYLKVSITNDLEFSLNTNKGRYYSVKKTFLLENFDDLMTNDI